MMIYDEIFGLKKKKTITNFQINTNKILSVEKINIYIIYLFCLQIKFCLC